MANHDNNNNIISMINSRDIGEVSSWLKLFPMSLLKKLKT